jgi:hypothetical protein
MPQLLLGSLAAADKSRTPIWLPFNLRPSRSVGIAEATQPQRFQLAPEPPDPKSGHRISGPKPWRFSALFGSVHADAIKAP